MNRVSFKALGIGFCIIFLLASLAAAETNIGLSVTSDENINVDQDLNGENIVSTNNFYAANKVDVYFNGISLEDYTPEREIKVESNTDAAMSAFLGSFKIMADYRTGQRSSVSYVEGKLLKYFQEITDEEIKDFHKDVTAKELEAMREWLQRNTNQIIINMQGIDENRQAIQKNRQDINAGFTSLGAQMEAQDLALKKINKQAYCDALVEVMKEKGYGRVKCDVHSRHCYNGKTFGFEGGRDYCLEIDDQERPPQCYADSTCGTVTSIELLAGDPVIIKTEFYNPSEGEPRLVKARVEFYDETGERVNQCQIELGTVKPLQTESLSGECPIDLNLGSYEATVAIQSSGKEILDRFKFDVNQDMIEIKKIVQAQVEPEPEPVVLEPIPQTYVEAGPDNSIIGISIIASAITSLTIVSIGRLKK